MNITVFETPEQLAKGLAARIIQAAQECILASGRFNFVLTGGSSPIALYKLLATEYKDKIDWQKVYFFMGDERYVPATDKDYNGAMALKTLLNPLKIPAKNIFFVNTILKPAAAAADYYQHIQQHFEGAPIIFDFILLGMGHDAHTASLFPGTAVLKNTTVNVAAQFVEKLDSWRITFTPALINQAKEIAFLVYGSEKAEALDQVRKKEAAADTYPARLIKGNVSWYVAQSALKS